MIEMAGLQKILKMYGRMEVGKVLWVWDYAKDEPRIKSEMTKDEWTASEKSKWGQIKEQLKKDFNG